MSDVSPIIPGKMTTWGLSTTTSKIKTWRCSIAGSYYPQHHKCFAGILLVLRFTRWLRLLWGFLNLLSLLFQYFLWRFSSPFQACRACVLCSRIIYELPYYQDSYRSLTKIAKNFVNSVSTGAMIWMEQMHGIDYQYTAHKYKNTSAAAS